jgi:hypothetical protein
MKTGFSRMAEVLSPEAGGEHIDFGRIRPAGLRLDVADNRKVALQIIDHRRGITSLK